jgi:hypothetical protein
MKYFAGLTFKDENRRDELILPVFVDTLKELLEVVNEFQTKAGYEPLTTDQAIEFLSNDPICALVGNDDFMFCFGFKFEMENQFKKISYELSDELKQLLNKS